MLDEIAGWDVPHVAAAVVAADGTVVATHGDTTRPFALASITKIVTGWTAMIAVEEGTVALDDPGGPEGATLRHLLAHAAGYGFDGDQVLSPPGRKRIYSNTGIEVAAGMISTACGFSFAEYLTAAVLEPLHMTGSQLDGSPAHGLTATVDDLVRLLGELHRPTLLSAEGATTATTVHFPELEGIVPGVGRFDPCPWGLGIEIHGDKAPHWMSDDNSPETFGHFGGAGTMLWVDPVAGVALVALTDRRFDKWPEAVDLWRSLSTHVLDVTLGV